MGHSSLASGTASAGSGDRSSGAGMKWFKRGCWLVAWSAWLWLGVGLFREWPRELGPRVAALKVEKGAKPLGFVGESDLIAWRVPDGSGTFQLNLTDGRSGRVIESRHWPR